MFAVASAILAYAMLGSVIIFIVHRLEETERVIEGQLRFRE
jgi:hypothetical protein